MRLKISVTRWKRYFQGSTMTGLSKSLCCICKESMCISVSLLYSIAQRGSVGFPIHPHESRVWTFTGTSCTLYLNKVKLHLYTKHISKCLNQLYIDEGILKEFGVSKASGPHYSVFLRSFNIFFLHSVSKQLIISCKDKCCCTLSGPQLVPCLMTFV
jgi:hypothetical protein